MLPELKIIGPADFIIRPYYATSWLSNNDRNRSLDIPTVRILTASARLANPRLKAPSRNHCNPARTEPLAKPEQTAGRQMCRINRLAIHPKTGTFSTLLSTRSRVTYMHHQVPHEDTQQHSKYQVLGSIGIIWHHLGSSESI